MFDLRTVFLVGALTAALGGVACLTLQRAYPPSTTALRSYGAALLAAGAGLGAIACRGVVPDWISFGAANALLASAAVLVCFATRLLFHADAHAPRFALAAVAAAAAMAALGSAPEQIGPRVALMAALHTAFPLAAAWTVVRSHEFAADRPARLMAAVLACYGATSALRGAALLGTDAAADPRGVLGFDPLQLAFALVFALFPIALTMAVLLQLSARISSDLRRRATTDELTGAALRRHFFELSAERLQVNRRNGLASYLLMIDLDHFKRINDVYGHALGDQVLRHVGQVLRRTTDPHGVLGRYGGEEFCALIAARDPMHAEAIVESVRSAVDGAPFHTGSQPLSLTVSIGVACVGRHDTIGETLQRADQCVYTAKREGRNRAVGFTAPSPEFAV